MSDDTSTISVDDNTPSGPEPFEQRRLAQFLAQRMIDALAEEKETQARMMELVKVHQADGSLHDVPLHQALKDLVTLVWPEGEKLQAASNNRAILKTKRPAKPVDEAGIRAAQEKEAAQDKTRRQLIQDLIEAGDGVLDTTADVMAHAGQLHQMAGMLARESLFATATKAKKGGEFDDLTKFFKPLSPNPNDPDKSPEIMAKKAVEALNKPAFEMTFTGHPTNTNSIRSMQKQRKLVETLATFKGVSNKTATKEALLDFARTPLLPMRDGRVAPLSVLEETQTMLYFLNNSYKDLPNTYQQFDSQLADKYKEAYDPSTLHLRLKFHSWGSSGDKDGNSNVNADTTLAAVVQHHRAILQNYTADLQALNLPGFEAEQQQLHGAYTAIASTGIQILKALRAHKYLAPEEFDRFSHEVQTALQPIDLPALQQKLEKAYKTEQDTGKKQATLDLLRRMRTFGLAFGHIEFRETAEEYERVLTYLLPDYAHVMHKITPLRDAYTAAKKAAADTAHPDQAKIAEAEMQRLREALKALEPERMAVLNGWLAQPEALQAKVAAAMSTLDQAAGKDYSKDDAAPIAYQTLKRMKLARDFPAMFHNNVLAECGSSSNFIEALVLQHAVGHNGKRPLMGVVPLFEEYTTLGDAPDIIKGVLENRHYQSHIEAVAKAHGDAKPVQQVQLAHSDNSKRAGMPAARALVYKAHFDMRKAMAEINSDRFASHKQAVALQFFEGGSQSDALRGGGRSISASINEFGLHDFAKMTFQGGDLLNFFNATASAIRLFVRNLSNAATKLLDGAKDRVNKIIKPDQMGLDDARIVAAFDASKQSYIPLYFSDAYRDFLNKLGYEKTVGSGNCSSRAGVRANPNQAQKSSKKLTDIDKARTIGLSETLQHGQMGGTWIGLDDGNKSIFDYLNEKGVSTKPSDLKNLYHYSSSIFRDIVDRVLYGLMRTNLNHVADITRNEDGTENELLPRFRKEYVTAMKLCLEAYTGKAINEFPLLAGVDFGSQESIAAAIKDDLFYKTLIQEVYPHVAQTLGDQKRFLELAHSFDAATEAERAKISNARDILGEKQFDEEEKKLDIRASLIHNMLDTVHHGRVPLIDDTTYAKLHCESYGIERPHVSRKIGSGLPSQ